MDLWLGKAVRVQVQYDVGYHWTQIKDDIANITIEISCDKCGLQNQV